MSPSKRTPYEGPALLSHGFRPFFLAALVFAVCVIPYWLATFFGAVSYAGPMTPVRWHSHEMLFGYTSAAIAGFLFTAIPNWTGRLPVRGVPLGFLAALWIAGRAALLGLGGLPHDLAALVDCSFLLAVLIAISIEIIAGKNWRNLKIVLPIGIYLAANVLFHLEGRFGVPAGLGQKLGLAVVVFLITLIGGRIIPSFTRNWLAARKDPHLPVAFNRFDGICLVVGATALLTWVFYGALGWLLALAGVLHFARLSRWQGIRTLPSPLLLILHIAYSFVPLGLLLLAFARETAAVHVLGIGAIGGMTVAVMIRASAGHTGRALTMSPALLVGFAMLPLAAILRACAPQMGDLYAPTLILSGALWFFGFALVLFRIGPWLWSGNPKRRVASQPPHP